MTTEPRVDYFRTHLGYAHHNGVWLADLHRVHGRDRADGRPIALDYVINEARVNPAAGGVLALAYASACRAIDVELRDLAESDTRVWRQRQRGAK